MPIFKSKYPEVVIPNATISEFVFKAIEPQDEGRVAFLDGINEHEKLTFGEVRTLAHKIAKGLQQKGIKKGDVVVTCLINTIYYPSIFHGILLAGGIVSTTNPTGTAEELSKQLGDCKPKYVFTFQDSVEKVKEALKLVKLDSNIISLGGDFKSLIANDGLFSAVQLSPNDIAALPYSSGTTGLPKGVMISHRAFVASIVQVQCLDALSLGPQGVAMAILPMFHIYGLASFLMRSLYFRFLVIIYPRWDLVNCLEGIQKHRVTFLNLVPPIVLLLAKHPIVQKYDLSSLKSVACGAAPLSGDILKEVFDRTGLNIRQGYGMTETPSSTMFIPYQSIRKIGSCGVLQPNVEAKVISVENGKELKENEIGEIWLRCPNMMSGYLNKPGENIIDKDGFLHTGDVGYVDDDGDWFIVDRVKELIKFNAFQVPPAELEAVILNHPKVQDTAVIGKPDAAAGELPVAFVVLKPNQKATETEIMDFVKDKVSHYKQLRGGVIFIDQIPKSPSGKILRRLLRAKLTQPVAKL